MAQEGEEAPAPPLDSDAAALAALVAQLEDDGAVEDRDEAQLAALMAAAKPKLTKEQLRRNAKKRRESVEKAVIRVKRAHEERQLEDFTALRRSLDFLEGEAATVGGAPYESRRKSKSEEAWIRRVTQPVKLERKAAASFPRAGLASRGLAARNELMTKEELDAQNKRMSAHRQIAEVEYRAAARTLSAHDKYRSKVRALAEAAAAAAADAALTKPVVRDIPRAWRNPEAITPKQPPRPGSAPPGPGRRLPARELREAVHQVGDGRVASAKRLEELAVPNQSKALGPRQKPKVLEGLCTEVAVRQIFANLDRDGLGQVEVKEIIRALQSFALKPGAGPRTGTGARGGGQSHGGGGAPAGADHDAFIARYRDDLARRRAADNQHANGIDPRDALGQAEESPESAGDKSTDKITWRQVDEMIERLQDDRRHMTRSGVNPVGRCTVEEWSKAYDEAVKEHWEHRLEWEAEFHVPHKKWPTEHLFPTAPERPAWVPTARDMTADRPLDTAAPPALPPAPAFKAAASKRGGDAARRRAARTMALVGGGETLKGGGPDAIERLHNFLRLSM